ncbi:hypothetical protein [Streptosporangium sp. NPDC051022]|uniref:hypothetical protein n=1 Tax=Streptosporangium sp. NPDC051022 TaxID=3155752 RepID=UPI0034170906
METDAVTDATSHLERLRAALLAQGWTAEFRHTGGNPLLHVQNPADPAMTDQVTCRDEIFRWVWGGFVGSVADTTRAAERIMFVLREIGS